MLLHPSALDLSTPHLRFLTDRPAAHRAACGTRWRRLSASRQVLLVLAHLRLGHTYAQLAAGFEVGVSTELVTAALLRYSGSAELEDTGDLRHDLVDYLVALAGLLSTTTGRAMQRVIQSARENPEVALPVNRIFERRLANLQQVVDHAVARGELPPVDGYFLAEMLTGPVHLYVSRGLHPFTRAEAERITDVVLAGLRHTAG